MDPLHAVVLGAIQGLTEFLPVSSSGHLVIAQHLFGLKEPEILFDVGVHLGTLAAVLFYFRRDLAGILAALARYGVRLFNVGAMRSALRIDADLRMAWLIIIGSVPTAVIGLLMKKVADQLFGSMLLAGCMLLITGGLLFLTRFAPALAAPARGGEPLFGSPKAFAIGVVQGLAIIPGISRSGSTIAAALFLGLSRDTAARFSFLLSIPAIMGAALLTAKDVTGEAAGQLPVLLLGALTSCVVGYLSLKFLVYIVNRGSLHMFAPYVWVVGILAVVMAW